MRSSIQDFGHKLEQRVRREQEFCLKNGARKEVTRAHLSRARSFLRPITSKRLLRRIAPPHPLRRLDPRPISSPFSPASRLFQFGCGWLLGASGPTKGWAVNDLQLSFSFIEQINAGNKIPQLLLFITNRFSPV